MSPCEVPVCIGYVWEVVSADSIIVVITDEDYRSYSYTCLDFDPSIAFDVTALPIGSRVVLYGVYRPMLRGCSCGASPVVTRVDVLRDPARSSSSSGSF